MKHTSELSANPQLHQVAHPRAARNVTPPEPAATKSESQQVNTAAVAAWSVVGAAAIAAFAKWGRTQPGIGRQETAPVIDFMGEITGHHRSGRDLDHRPDGQGSGDRR